MTTKYIGTNQYRYRYFKSPIGFIKFLLDVFISQSDGYINIVEENFPLSFTPEELEKFAKSEIKRIESIK